MKRSAFPFVLGVYGFVLMCPQTQVAACPGRRRIYARAVVGHDALHGDAEAGVNGDGGFEEGDGAFPSSRRAEAG